MSLTNESKMVGPEGGSGATGASLDYERKQSLIPHFGTYSSLLLCTLLVINVNIIAESFPRELPALLRSGSLLIKCK